MNLDLVNKKAFRFDINKCVACHACVVACVIENKTDMPLNWREINTFNKFHHPNLPVFHYSLACNHCNDAPCMHNCPALAYTRDLLSGAITHTKNHCIGCKYCTWACPYDAPKFDQAKGIVEKCTFCVSRTDKGLKPACANLCPTGALDYVYSSIISPKLIGFESYGIGPSIDIIPLRKENMKPKIITETEDPLQVITDNPKESKISFKKEWPLYIFTLSMACLVAWLFAFAFTGYKLNPMLFTAISTVAGFFSMLHLGKKQRAWRAVLNIKNSWLSREILSFGLFFLSTTVYFFFLKDDILLFLALFSGAFLLLSIDKVYHILIQATPLSIHSAHVVLTGFLFSALLFQNYFMFFLLSIFKTSLYAYRKYYFWKQGKPFNMFVSAWRLDMLVSFPLIFWFINFSDLNLWTLASVFVGELIDRAEYYQELDVMTPEKQIRKDFNRPDNK